MDAYEYTPIVVTERDVTQDILGGYNTLTFKLQKDTAIEPYTDICFIEGSLYYSWPNISARFNNNSFRYIWIDNQVRIINIPDGMYNIRDIQAFLEAEMVKNTHYLEYKNPLAASDIRKMFFIQFSVNLSQLVATLTLTPVPTAEFCTANNLFLPLNATWALSAVTVTPVLNIPSDNNFKTLLGFSPGDYPRPPTTRQFIVQYNSDTTPQIQPQTTILISCDAIQNGFMNNGTYNDVVFAFTPTVGFSELQPLTARTQVWSNIKSGVYDHITFRIYDQTKTPLNLIDPSIMFVFLVRRLKAS